MTPSLSTTTPDPRPSTAQTTSPSPPPRSSLSHDTTSNEKDLQVHPKNVVTDDARDRPLMEMNQPAILTGRKFAVVFAALLLSLLLIALDQTILATALPKIASDFDAFTLQGWVATSFVLAQTVFLLFWGQAMRIFSAKWILITTVAIFETGSLICGVSQNIHQLIVGRTVSGVGASGIFVSMIQMVAQATRLEDRPMLFSMFGAVFGLSSIIGPLIGGVFTDHVTWRWCFVINLPIGGLSVTAVTFLVKSSPPLGVDLTKSSPRNMIRQAANLDFVGAALVAGAVTCLVLALQWGGNTKLWNDKDIIICFVFAGVFTVVFIAWERYLGEKAMIPLIIFKSRSIYALVCSAFLSRFSLLLFSYYIPIFYQAVKHHTATASGISILPFMMGAVLSAISSGQIVGRFGYYWPFLVASPVFITIGSGLLYLLDTNTSSAKIIGFQILAGVGVGFGMQNSLLAMQVEFRDTPAMISQATSMGSFGQFLGGTVGLGVAEPVFASELGKNLVKYAPLAPASIVKQSPTAIYTNVLPDLIPGVVHAYMESLKIVFLIGVPVAGIGLLASLFIDNIKIQKEISNEGKDAKGDIEKGLEAI